MRRWFLFWRENSASPLTRKGDGKRILKGQKGLGNVKALGSELAGTDLLTFEVILVTLKFQYIPLHPTIFRDNCTIKSNTKVLAQQLCPACFPQPPRLFKIKITTETILL